MRLDALRYLAAFGRGGLAPLLRQALGEATLADVLARAVRKRPDALALEVGNEAWTYHELEEASLGAAQLLLASGAQAGDVVALVGQNSLTYVALLLGGARLGITLALVHPELGGEPLRQALEVAGAQRVLCEQGLLGAVQAATELPTLAYDPEARAPFRYDVAPALAADRARYDLALIYTSGTTGLPKACRLPHSRVLAAACLFGAPLYDFRPGDKLLCALPLHHGSPLMLGLGACLVTGTPLRLERQFSASRFMAIAEQSRATALLYVGDLGRMLLASAPSPSDRRHGLRLAVGNGMAADVWPEFQRRFGIPRVREFYAATESPVGLLNLSGRVGAVGNLPYAWMFGLKLVKVDEATGELVRDARGELVECDSDEPGELLVRARKSGVGVYHGYVDPSATEARLVHTAAGALFRTGDVLRRDREGFYYFVERRGDSFRFRGENVAVALVERELCAVPGVEAALVTGVSVPGYDGQVGMAAVVVRPGFEAHELAQLAQRLPRSAVPRFVRRMAELPRTSSLKLKRRELAAQGVDPERVADEVWAWLEGDYVRLSPETYRDILGGSRRL